MLKCCGCQTNFILSLGGSFLFSKKFLLTPSLTGGLVMPIRRTKKPHQCITYTLMRSFLLYIVLSIILEFRFDSTLKVAFWQETNFTIYNFAIFQDNECR